MSFDLWAPATGELRPGACRAYRCKPCHRRRMREWPYLLGQGRPERLLTLTLAPADRERRRGQVRDLAYRLRRRGYATEWAWNTERNPRGTGVHVHLLQWGDYVPQRELADMWGGRRVDIRRIGGDAGEDVSAYLLKEGLDRAGYIVKESYHLDGRPVHLSRGYLRGRTVRSTRQRVALELYGEPERWVPVARVGMVGGSWASCTVPWQGESPRPDRPRALGVSGT